MRFMKTISQGGPSAYLTTIRRRDDKFRVLDDEQQKGAPFIERGAS
jgi:hypothetical protein